MFLSEPATRRTLPAGSEVEPGLATKRRHIFGKFGRSWTNFPEEQGDGKEARL